MLCNNCRNENDADAQYCEHCGGALAAAPGRGQEQRSRIYLSALIVLVVAAVAAIGYYKFFLPGGVAAVVNGEEISLSEVDAVMRGALGSESLPPEILSRARYKILNDLITERIAWQEAKKAGIRVEPQEVEAAYAQLASSAGNNGTSFEAQVRSQYGGARALRQSLERRLAIRKYINENVTAGIKDPTIAGSQVNQWLQAISARSSVRVALAEQLPGSGGGGSGGCGSGSGCCGSGSAGGCGSGKGCSSAPRTGSEASPQAQEARTAALAYWRGHYGDDKIETKVLDFGCHIQVDVVKGEKIARSLRYQNGSISEM